jgi:hypothetical protein
VTDEELSDRFEYHPPRNEIAVEVHRAIREGCQGLAALVDDACKDGREKAVAMTKIEEAMFWANASVARHGV